MVTIGDFKKLTSKSRSIDDQRALQTIQGVPATAGSTLVKAPIIQNTPITSLQDIRDAQHQENYYYQNALNSFRKQYHVDDKNFHGSFIKDIQDIAAKTSAYYKKFRGTDYITLDDHDWAEIAAQYRALEKYKGQDEAIHFLNGQIRDNVSSNQSIFEKARFGLEGIGASAVGAVVSFAGALKGAIDYMDGAYKDKDYLSGFENFMNSVIDNNWTRYGNDIVQYGAFLPSNLERAKSYATPYERGISDLDVVQTQRQAEGSDSFFDQIFNINTIPLAVQQGGFTVASMGLGWGEAKIAGLAFQGAKDITMAAKGLGIAKSLTATKNILSGIQKAENLTSKFVIPGLTGTAEGLVEGLNTKQQALQDGVEAVKQAHAEAVSEEVNKILSNSKFTTNKETGAITYYDKSGRPINIAELYKQKWEELEPKYNEALQQVDYASSKAGINNFFINSAINGLMNATLKAGLQAPSVQKALQDSRLLGWAQPKGNFSITGEGSNITVTPKFGLGKQIWQVIKEPLGEFGEEYAQSISDATARGGASNNIHQFIQNKYSGDDSVAVGDTFATDWGAAWSALTNSVTDQESLKQGIYGALASIIGTPALGRRAVTANGEKTYFGRGLNAAGEKESTMEWLSRIAPWRSGMFNTLNESKRQRQEAQETAQQLQDWLRDGDNMSKFDGLVGTRAWAQNMETAAATNDEFGFRNSLLGKTINDAFMLEKLKGTQYYDAIINQLSEVANLEEGTDLANQYINELRDNVNTKFDSNVSDEAILKSIKSNANKMLNTMSRIQEESGKIDQLLGDVNDDTKQTLIFGQLNLDDWNERSTQLANDINGVTSHISNSVEDRNDLTKTQQQVLAKYGTFANASKQSFRLQEQKSNLEEDIKNLNSRKKDLTDKEKVTLKEKKVRLNTINRELSFIDSMGDVSESQTILSEKDIMALDPISRANILLRGSKKLYTSTHTDGQGNEVNETRAFYSPAQQAIIDNLIQQGTAVDRNFLSKVVDQGRIENSRKTFMEQYNAILSDKNSFNHLVQRAKQQAADVLTKKRFELLNSIQDYSQFADEMDKVLTGEGTRAQAMIMRGLENSKNENFARYKATKKTTEDLFNKLVTDDKFNNIDGNTADMFAHTVTYLNNQGVDLHDTNAVTEALTKSNENGNLFQQYVERVNESLPENERTVFTSVPEAIQTYKDILQDVIKDREEATRNARPVIPEATRLEDSKPANAPDAVEQSNTKEQSKPGIFGKLGNNSANDGFTSEEKEGKPIEVEQEVKPVHTGDVLNSAEKEAKRINNKAERKSVGQEEDKDSNGNNTKDPIIDSFETNSNKVIANAAKKSKDFVKSSSNTYSKEAKKIADDSINSLSENEFDDVGDLKSAITRKANELESSKDDNSIQAATLLRQAIANIKPEKVVESPSKHTSVFDKLKKEAERKNRQIEQTMNPNAGPNAGFIASSNMEYIINNYPDGPIAKFIQSHGILDYLKSEKITGDTNVYFITDENLTNDVKQSIGDRYGDGAMPIVAVVEDKNGQYELNGKHYQPIAIMPSNNMLYSAGSANMVKIREAASNNTGVSFINYEGKPLVTKPYGKGGFIKARSADDNYQGPNNSIQDLLISDLLPTEQAEINSLSTEDKKKHTLYNKSKRRFIKGLQVRNSDGRKSLVFRQNNLKDGGGNDIILFTTPVGNTLGRTSGKSVVQTVADGESLVHFNSRTEGVERAIATMLKTMPETATGTSETIDEIEGMAANLEKKISNYIFLSQNGYKYVIKATNNVEGNERIFNISLQDQEGNTIHLANFNKNSSPETVATELLKNLLTDNGDIRTFGSREFAMWQTNYNDVSGMGSNSMAASNVNDWIEDNILEARATALTYRVSGINLNNPFKQDGTPRYPIIANPDNATPATPVNTPTVTTDQVNANNATVDAGTGAVVDGKPKVNENEAVKTAESKVEEIIERSKTFELTEDGKNYRNTKTGRLYSRVTSVIQADREVGKEEVITDSNGVPITLYRGYSLEKEAEDIDETVQNRAKDYVEGVGAKYHFTTDREEAEGYAKVHSDVDKKPVQVTSYFISNNAKIVEFKDFYDFLKNKEKRSKEIEKADIILLKQGTLTQGASEYIVRKGKKNVIIKANKLGRFDSNSPWVLPSTNIGTSVDEFVRDFFAGSLKENYPNATKEQWNKFAEQLQILKNRFEAAGIYIVPRDIVAAGTLQIADTSENIYDVNVAGTLDLLAYNDKGEFFIFDMKTLHNPNSVESKKHKWGQQTSLYQKFLENEFGIKVKGRFIIPIQVSYPSPNSIIYEQGKGTQININGQEFMEANPTLMEAIPIDYIEPNIMWDKMTEDEKELASNIVKESETPITDKPVEIQVKDEGVDYVDPNIGLNIDSSESSLFDDPLLNGVELPSSTGIERTTVIPTEYQWDNLTEEQRTALMSKNITKEQWETYQDDEMEHELECLG